MAVVYRNVGNQVARMAGLDPEMDRVAGELLALAKANAVKHILTGAYISKLSVANVPGKKGVRDRLVISGDIASMSIEYGHAQRVGGKGAKNAPDFKWVPGQYILTHAIAAIPGHRYNSFGAVR